jgi:hypothetical protein
LQSRFEKRYRSDIGILNNDIFRCVVTDAHCTDIGTKSYMYPNTNALKVFFFFAPRGRDMGLNAFPLTLHLNMNTLVLKWYRSISKPWTWGTE